MNVSLWFFLSVATFFTILFLIVLLFVSYKQNMKKMEIEALKIQKENLQHEVEQAVNKKLGDQLSRIEVLEAIVTDKNYELNEKITRLK